MQRIDTYIQEKLHINKDVKDPYNYHPKTKDELVEIIQDKIKKEGLGTEDNPLDLNDIDTSEIVDMSFLFHTNCNLGLLSRTGYFDISNWDVSNVTNMEYMFFNSDFNGDISRWNVSKLKNMIGMFGDSKFTGKNGNISKWDVGGVKKMYSVFLGSPLENNPPKWYNK